MEITRLVDAPLAGAFVVLAALTAVPSPLMAEGKRSAEIGFAGYRGAETLVDFPAAALPALSTTAANDGIENGVHGYTPKNYVRPKEPAVLERLEWFKDQKLALMMCFGLYSNIGIIESWCLSDAKWRGRKTRTSSSGSTGG
jgi:hypothetical protein